LLKLTVYKKHILLINNALPYTINILCRYNISNDCLLFKCLSAAIMVLVFIRHMHHARVIVVYSTAVIY